VRRPSAPREENARLRTTILTTAQTPERSGVPILTADDHLKHLLLAETGEPWFSSLARNLKDLIRPQKLPPLQLTSKPVAVKNIWGDYRYGKQAGVSSTAIHVVAVILMFTWRAARPSGKPS